MADVEVIGPCGCCGSTDDPRCLTPADGLPTTLHVTITTGPLAGPSVAVNFNTTTGYWEGEGARCGTTAYFRLRCRLGGAAWSFDYLPALFGSSTECDLAGPLFPFYKSGNYNYIFGGGPCPAGFGTVVITQ